MTPNFWTIAVSIWTYVSIGFLAAVYYKRNDVADVQWGGGIFLASVVGLKTSGHTLETNPVAYSICLFVLVWACRLTWHIGMRFVSKPDEDSRYAKWRRTWSNFYLRSYFQVFLLQGSLMVAVALVVPAAAMAHHATDYSISVALLGACIFAGGFAFEVVADRQLNGFVKKADNKDRIMTEGLWKFSRHPNYFGEITTWWGLFIMAASLAFRSGGADNILPLLLAAVSPLTITYLIFRVSGIPMLEARYRGNREFEKYKMRTPALIPWFPKTDAGR
jgi:steroid 5-alpha reductase family enzyme